MSSNKAKYHNLQLPEIGSNESTYTIVVEKPTLNFSKATYQAGILILLYFYLDKMMNQTKPLEVLVYNFLDPYGENKLKSIGLTIYILDKMPNWKNWPLHEKLLRKRNEGDHSKSDNKSEKPDFTQS